MTEIMEKATTAIAEYSPTAAALADLRARFADVVFDVTTTKGDKEARAARMELVKLRTSLEAKRKELKAPALERSRMIDSEAKRIEAEILALETPIDRQIKAEEERRERERQAKAEAERRRVAEIQERIDQVKAFPVRAAGKSSIVIEALLGDLVAIAVDETFAEFRPAAEAAHAQALAAMRELLAASQAHEEEARRLRAEREALEQQRKEDEARRAEEDRIAREAHEAEVARIKAEREAEEARLAEARAAQEAELRAQREAEEARAAEQRRIEAERQAEERRRLDAERAELERQQAEIDRQRREHEERETAARVLRQQAEHEAQCRLEEAAPYLLAAARLALAVFERCDSHVAEAERATDAEWDAAVAALRKAIAISEDSSIELDDEPSEAAA
ncbi:MAG TPA: DUF1351 domain-containing protein [Zeimonas sp.]